MTREKSKVVIVDAYSAGNQLAPECIKDGYSCIHVQSSKDIPDTMKPSFRMNDFTEHFICNEDRDEVLAHLKGYPVQCVIPGTETGVELADYLSSKLGLLSNGEEKSHARRNKFYMSQAAAEWGLRTIRQVNAKSLQEALDFAQSAGWPVVVKPPASCGTDTVVFCQDLAGVEQAFIRIFGQTNAIDLVNTSVLIQEYIGGTEYIVNTVNYQGKAVFTKFLRYKKIMNSDATFIYDRDELLDGTGEEEAQLIPYTRGILQALNLQYGPAHAEIKIDDKGPVLVEIGARMDGLTNPAIEQRTIGYGQLDLTLDCYLHGGQRISALPETCRSRASAFVVHLISQQEGRMRGLNDHVIQRIQQLESFAGLRTKPQNGDLVMRTANIFTSPGEIHLVHQDRDQLEKDYEIVRQLEKSLGIFLLE